MGNMFPLLQKIGFASKNICVPTNRKDVSNTWKNIFIVKVMSGLYPELF